MLLGRIFAAVLCLPAVILAQSTVPSGTLVPVSLDHRLNSNKVHAGQPITATVMQDIPGTSIHRNARVLGHILNVDRSGGGLKLELRFDEVRSHSQSIRLKTSLRALASFLEVQEAERPEEMGSRGLTPETWDTQQIGGDQVYRGGGPVTERGEVVGRPAAWGVLTEPHTLASLPCRGVIDDNSRPQAFWLFSINACGVYGFPSVRIEHAGRTNPQGTIVLSSSSGKLDLRSGSALLLRVS